MLDILDAHQRISVQEILLIHRSLHQQGLCLAAMHVTEMGLRVYHSNAGQAQVPLNIILLSRGHIQFDPGKRKSDLLPKAAESITWKDACSCRLAAP